MNRLTFTLVAAALALTPPHAQAQSADSAAAPCRPVFPLTEGVDPGDSVTIGEFRVARTARSIRTAYSLRIDGPPFRPGERVIVVLDERRLGTAVFDGCRLVREWPGPWPGLDSVRTTVVGRPSAAAGGYQTLRLLSTGSHP